MHFFITFLCSFLFIKTTVYAKELHCGQILKASYSVFKPRSFDTLVEKMESLGVSLSLNEGIDIHKGSLDGDYFEIFAHDQKGNKIAEVSMEPLYQSLIFRAEQKPVYTSHISIYSDDGNGGSSMRGRGLGTYLYAAAAWSIYRLGGVLVSSSGPSSKAIEAWERMVDSGWAVSGREKSVGVLDLYSSLDLSSSYQFHQNLLEKGFFDDFEELIEDEDMVFIRKH